MKVSKEQAAQNRERVVETAARLFREHGYNGIGVADLMKGAGLTHGGFYGNFGSKEALLAEAATQAVDASLVQWDAMESRHPEAPLKAVTQAYLSARHRDHPGLGCTVAALGPEVARLSPEVRHAVSEGVSRQVGKLASLMPPGSEEQRRKDALATYAAMVGALVIARAVNDEALSQEVLSAALEAINRNTEE
ncbi:TetR/AcrR family transcriptional regulator [Massilia sp. CF038]|uniref:TetR/AcrR family transcriptional regulator n=1 Tax=Massilia sp. CF038 TaxID=1881045 RepID=UPI0009103CE5|nr:TetR/AcrR family transcriptional regulator [Massilia sp. CF038]SHG66148.1 transcriptional regulator, TetR family [Massilia sp. CF038]